MPLFVFNKKKEGRKGGREEGRKEGRKGGREGGRKEGGRADPLWSTHEVVAVDASSVGLGDRGRSRLTLDSCTVRMFYLKRK